MKESEENLFYVGIKEHVELRRNVLESSKAMIQTLQRMEMLKEIKMRKHEKISALKEIIREINKLNSRLRLELPRTKMMEEPLKKEKIERKEAKIEYPKDISEVKEIKKAEKNEIEKLDEELSMIEEKLGKLS